MICHVPRHTVCYYNNNIAAYDPRGKALRAAAKQGHGQIVRALVSQLQDAQQISRLNQCNAQRETALLLAVQQGHLGVAHILHHAGADPLVLDASGQTLLHVASLHGHDSCVAWLLQQPNTMVDINALDIHNRTPLYWACRHGHLTVVQKLVRAGADVTKGKAPTVGAATAGHLHVLQFLQEHSSDALGLVGFCPKKNTRTILHVAAQQGHLPVVQYLIRKAGASVLAADDRGYTVSL